ncbi:IS3 family transposase [Enterococcus sp. AZ034]|uniref:IS3 family transposase n=1 Tax=Enterococcus sp. AZ034 TaxID=2774833 RepID=UPI003F69405D
MVKDNRNSIRKEVLHLIKFVKKTVAIPNNRRISQKTKGMTPCEYREHALAV